MKMKMMLRCIIASAALVLSGLPLAAQTAVEGGVRVSDIHTDRSGDKLYVTMDIDLSAVRVKSNREVVLTPVIHRGADSLALAPVVVAGKNRYFHFLRRNHALAEGARLYRAGRADAPVRYQTVVPYAAWMARAGFAADWRKDGCCVEPEAGRTPLDTLDFEPRRFVPRYLYVQPPFIEKEDSAERTAHIIFIVNKTDINYKRPQNIEELAKIRRTVDSLRNDRDYTVTSLTVRGYASPESPYKHNEYLANGRTETLRDYIMQLYSFPEGFITTEAVPEDWAGLERYVAASYMPNRDALLELIRSDMEPDAKEALIRKTYPDDYRFLLNNVYPGLRRSEYKVRYRIRRFTDIEEIKRLLRTEPRKLNLNEMYAAAQTMEEGSDEFLETFRTAAVMFPDDPVANLNAANAAMSRGERAGVERMLAKAGDSPQAVYARGVYAALTEQYEEAARCFESARRLGVAEAADALKQLEEITRR